MRLPPTPPQNNPQAELPFTLADLLHLLPLGVIGWLLILLLLSGCMGTGAMQDVMVNATYACGDIVLDGPATDSSGKLRAIKLPTGETLTDARLSQICPP